MHSLRKSALALSLAAALAADAAAQEAPRFLVSTTSDATDDAGTQAFDDADLVLVRAGDTPTVQRAAGHWLATLGFAPGDVDALARRPGEPAGTWRSLAFSLLSNEGGVLDGDVLGLAEGGGVEVLVSEATLVAGLGVPSESVDVDAIGWDDLGRLYFSIQSDLDGTLLGTVQDGDVLRLDPDGSVARVLTEMDVEQKLLEATGVAAAVGDVIGLDIVAGEAYVVVQSPSAYDGGVLDTGTPAQILLPEDQVGLAGAELDALAVVEEDEVLPVVLTAPQAADGATLQFDFRGDPGSGLLVLYAGSSGWLPFSTTPGYGAWALDPADPWLNAIVTLPALPIAPLDGAGTWAADYDLPAGVGGPGLDGATGWSFQAIDCFSFEVSCPFRVAAL